MKNWLGVEHQPVGKEHLSNEKNLTGNSLWPFWDGGNVTLSMAIRDLQLWDQKVTNWITWRLFRVYVGDEILPQLCGDYFINHEIRILSLNNQDFNKKYPALRVFCHSSNRRAHGWTNWNQVFKVSRLEALQKYHFQKLGTFICYANR